LIFFHKISDTARDEDMRNTNPKTVQLAQSMTDPRWLRSLDGSNSVCGSCTSDL